MERRVVTRRTSGDNTRYGWNVRPDPHQARRWHLMVAARAVIAREGLKFSVEDITREAGLAKGTFYLYFTSRDALLDALRARLAEDAATVMLEAAQGPWEGLWQRVLRELSALAVSQRDLDVVFEGVDASTSPGCQVFPEAIQRILEAGVTQQVLSLPPCSEETRAGLMSITVVAVKTIISEVMSRSRTDEPVSLESALALLTRLLAFKPRPVNFVSM